MAMAATMSDRIPSPPPGWSAETKTWWRDFWASDQGRKLPPSLHPSVRRLFGWYHRRTLLERRVDRLFATPDRRRRDPLYAAGSTGQPKVNPLVAELRAIEDQIETLERRVFGDQSAAPTNGGASDPAALLAAANKRFAELAVSIEAEDPRDPRLELLPGGKSASA
jgi:hypothetical protein